MQSVVRRTARAVWRVKHTVALRVGPGTEFSCNLSLPSNYLSNQALLVKLLETWTYEGYIRWLQGVQRFSAILNFVIVYANILLATGIQIQYTTRRDYFIDLLADEFELRASIGSHAHGVWNGCTIYNANIKGKSFGLMSEKRPTAPKAQFSFVPPAAGMFVWVQSTPLNDWRL